MKAERTPEEAEGPGNATVPSAALIEEGPHGDIVWRPLKAAWLTHHFVADRQTHVKGGYTWDASRYLPVLTLNDEGDPVLGFARSSSK